MAQNPGNNVEATSQNKPINTPLHKAAMAGDINGVCGILDAYASDNGAPLKTSILFEPADMYRVFA